MNEINELNLAYIKRFMKKKRGWVDQGAVENLKHRAKGEGGHLDRGDVKALGHGDLYTHKEGIEGNVARNLVHKIKNNKADIMAHAVTSGMYHVGGLDFGADVAASIHHELKHLPTNLKVMAHKIKIKFVKEADMNEGIFSALKGKISGKSKEEKVTLSNRIKRATAGSTPTDRKDWMGKTKANESDDHTSRRLSLQNVLAKHNSASKIDSIPQMFHKMMATRVAAILNKDTEKSKLMKGMAANELKKMKEDELIDPDLIINEETMDEGINRPPKKSFHIVQHKESGQHVMVKTKTVGGAQALTLHPASKYTHVGAFKSKKHAKNYISDHLSGKHKKAMDNYVPGKKHDNGLGIREVSVGHSDIVDKLGAVRRHLANKRAKVKEETIEEAITFKPWQGPFTGTPHGWPNKDRVPLDPEADKVLSNPSSTREQRLAAARQKMTTATTNAKNKLKAGK